MPWRTAAAMSDELELPTTTAAGISRLVGKNRMKRTVVAPNIEVLTDP